MKFSKETLATLKNLASINSGIVLHKGNFIMTRSVNGATYAEVNIPEEIDVDLAIYDLNAFLSILSLADENSEISLNVNGDVLIKSARSEINWPSADPSTIVTPKKAIQFPPAFVEFDITSEDFGKVMRVSRGLGADTLEIKSEKGNIVINAYNKNADTKLSKPLYTFIVSEYKDDKEFNFVLNILNMKMLNDNYKVKLWAQNEMFASKFESENVSYVLAVESESNHKF